MSEAIISTEESLDHLGPLENLCDVCDRRAEVLLSFPDLPGELKSLVAANASADGILDQVCARCIALFERAQRQLDSHAAVFEQTSYVLPTPLRLDADERFTGKGVTIAFLDSGFYAHPDLTTPQNRILAYHSIFNATEDKTSLETIDVASWHGMMTSVVAAGNGSMSDGFYRGIASESNAVLVKIGRTGRITEDQIQSGLEWVLALREKYQIRVVNISAGGDFEESYLTNPLAQVVERCVREGLVVVCAVGNAGMSPGHSVVAPASAPSAISVGGLDDQNSRDRARRGMYRSSYGPTLDGLQKPEVIAPGIWVAAPILPNTPTAGEAALYFKLEGATDAEVGEILRANVGIDKDLDEARELPVPLLRQLITIKLREGNVINSNYKYVDGTSFSAPIVASVVACMLEANPALTPQQVKRILIDTSERVPAVEVERQGWGVVSPRRAVERALESN